MNSTTSLEIRLKMFRLKIRRFSRNWEFWTYSKEMYYLKKGCVEEKRNKTGATTGRGLILIAIKETSIGDNHGAEIKI